MTAPSYAAFRRYEQRLAAMLEDPDLGGDLLLVGIALLRRIALGVEYADEGERGWVGLARRYFLQEGGRYGHLEGDNALSHAVSMIQQAMYEDRRRYSPPFPRGRGDCQSILPRAQRPCGRPASLTAPIVDVLTGEVTYVQSCSRHRHEAETAARANRAEREGRIIPKPYANRGGVLQRHLPEFDWHRYWTKSIQGWEEPPERPHGPQAATPAAPTGKPRLTLVVGDGDDDPAAARAMLRLIPGGN